MSFWRKLNKVVFYISLVVSCLAVLGGAIWGFTQNDFSWLGLVILLGGAILIPVLFSAWGILLEFLDNVADIRRAVCNGQRMQNQPQVFSGQSSQTLQKEQIIKTMPEWTCTGCGEKNENESKFCYNCGKPKE